MNSLLLILIFLVAIVAIILIWFAWREGRKNNTSVARELVGICTTAVDRMVRKRVNLVKALALFNEKPELTNSEIRERLGVSERTVVGYMSDLEKQGLVEQVGATGRGTYYRLRN